MPNLSLNYSLLQIRNSNISLFVVIIVKLQLQKTIEIKYDIPTPHHIVSLPIAKRR